MRVRTPLVFLMLIAACSSQQTGSEQPAPSDPPAAAPWTNDALARASVPEPYHNAWSNAGNRASCALIAFANSAVDGAQPRTATFSGGWGVAYDRPELRSAFGVAGTSVNAADPTYDDWPFKRTWSDGSTVGYGPEGGTGPNQLAYLRIPGQSCLYNVWSRLGRSHLEQLLNSLRFVETR